MRQRLTIILTFVVIIGLLIILNTLTYVNEDKSADVEANPNRSTYHSGPTGTRALHDFLNESGYKVIRWRDTPEKLKEYAEIFGARRGLWRYLTGPQQEVERTVVKGFHTAMAKLPRPGSDPHMEAFDIMHGERLVLVDRMGRIRGFYDADDQDRLIRDARSLTAGGRG